MTAEAAAPLAGVRVLDLTRLLPGNFASLQLAGLGAEVIKVEPLAGDGTRAAWPFGPGGESGAHLVLNRGKGSIAVDLKAERGREVLLRLVESSDVLLDSFRPGVMDRLGLGPEALAEANPALVHVTINAFGVEGPYATRPAHDLNAVGMAGLLSLAECGGAPRPLATQAGDLFAALQAVVAVLAGLRVAESGPGADHPGSGGDAGPAFFADVAMTDAAASVLTLASGHFAATGENPSAPGMLTGALGCYDTYRCADGRYVTVGGLEPKFFARMSELMGLPDAPALQYDLGAQPALRTMLQDAFATRSRDEWVALLAGEDTCVAPVNDVAEALADPNLTARGVISHAEWADGGSAPVVRAVPWLAEPAEFSSSAPALGQDTLRLLAELGFAADEVQEMLGAGVVASSES